MPKKSTKETKKLQVNDEVYTLTANWINPDRDKENLQALCSLTVSEFLWVNVSLIYSSKNKSYFCSFPSYQRGKGKNAEYVNYAGPCSKDNAADISALANELGALIEDED